MKRTGSHLRVAYTLIELLVVIAIAASLMVIMVPSLRGMMDSGNLSRAGQLVGDQINLARQIAASSNSTVEVRFVNLPKYSASGYSAVQIWGINRSGAMGALRALAVLPLGTVVSDNTSVSPAFLQSFAEPLTTGSMSIQGGSAQYASFQIRPAGIILPAITMKNFCFTVIPSRAASSGTLPSNYATIQVNPLTAAAFAYRP
ncbi:MAG: Verru_Chthon cassette protein D [Chthoniobacteraceae bacterium]